LDVKTALSEMTQNQGHYFWYQSKWTS